MRKQIEINWSPMGMLRIMTVLISTVIVCISLTEHLAFASNELFTDATGANKLLRRHHHR
jgi:hypothetical protein